MMDMQPRGPQHSFLFRLIAFFSRMQLWYLVRRIGNPRILIIAFVFIAGATALGIISIAAYLTNLPLLFPQLGPSAFILFHTPMATTASPRNVILAHSLAVLSGLFSLWIVGVIFPGTGLFDSAVMNWYRILAIALTMGLIGILMVITKSVHPPAAASALIAAMGYLEHVAQVLGIIGAVVLLVFEAILFNRIIGGLPYPLWRTDVKQARIFGEMAGIPEIEGNFWRQLAMKTVHRR